MSTGGENKNARLQTIKARLLDATDKFKAGDLSALEIYARCLYEHEVACKILSEKGYPRISDDCTKTGLIAMADVAYRYEEYGDD